MMMCEDDYELPVKFTIESDKEGSYRCSKKEIPGPGPYLTWLTEDTIEVGGKEYKLRWSPACSAVRGDYVFTTTDFVFDTVVVDANGNKTNAFTT